MLVYRVGFTRRNSHRLDVTLTLEAYGARTRLWLPTWTPGSYLIREFARHLRDIWVRDDRGVISHPERVDKTTFEFATEPGRTYVVEYTVYAFDRSVRTSFLDSRLAMLNGASVFFALAGRESEPCEVELELPKDAPTWTTCGGLRRDERGRYQARDYAELIDGPLFAGELVSEPFDVEGIPHRFVIAGEGNYDVKQLAEDSRRIIAAARANFGPLPYPEYTIVLLTTSDAQGGLEHRSSTVLAFPRYSFREDKSRIDLLTLIAHEHFHAWNVKRTRPSEFANYDVRNETYTRALWICEGVTSYFDELIPLRAGLLKRETYLDRLGDEITKYLETPGRLAQSLEESSLTTWTRYYRQDEDYPNSGISYYQKGALVALLLDLEIRFATQSARCLDDVMRELFAKYEFDSPGFTTREFETLAAHYAEVDLSEFFERAVRSTAELDLAGGLARFGIRLDLADRSPQPSVRDWLGLRIKAGAQPLKIDTVELGSPSDRAGLSANDEVVAWNGMRAQGGTLAQRISELRGKSLRLTVFRDDRLHEFEIAVPESAQKVRKLVVDRSAPKEALERLERWLGTGG